MTDLNYDGVLDVVVLRDDGKLLFRAGSGNGSFQAPIVINPDSAEAVRDATLVTSDTAFLVTIYAKADVAAVYTMISGQFVRIATLSVPGISPSHIVGGDVDGDGLIDVIATSAASGKVFVYLQRPDDDLSDRLPTYQIDVGSGVSDVTLVDVNGDGLSEIVVTDQLAGDVRVLLNSATAPFTSQLRFRAGSGLTSVAQVDGSMQIQSRDAPIALVAGLFNDDAFPDLAVLNAGANRVDILLGDGVGGFFNPTPEMSLPTGLDPVAIVTADWNEDGRLDLAVLNQGSDDLSIFLNADNGRFTEQMMTDSTGHASRINAGNSPTGLSAGDIDGDGHLGLLLGNAQGDVLTLLGHGDGTFSPYRRIDQHVGLAITGVNSKAGPAFALFDQSLDQVTFQSNDAGSTFQQGREEGLLAPSAVTFADLNADGIDDLIITSAGSNVVFVYLGRGDDLFDVGHRFSVGTDPEAITVGDLNADGIQDLVVANHGSNDVSLLFGQGQGDDWTLAAGPRLRAGSGPVATAVADMNADGLVDILVANHESNDVYLLAGLGRGFFNDKQPVIQRTGFGPVQIFVGHFDNDRRLDVVTVNAGSHDLTLISGGGSKIDRVRAISLSGIDPVAAIVQDFNHDGRSDLIVANASGQFSLWLGGSSEVRTIKTQGSLDVANISELVLGRVTSNSVEVYFTSTGSNTATLATFAINFNSAPSTNPVSAPSVIPLPIAFYTYSNQAASTNTFTAIGDEAVSFVSFDRTAGFTPLPIAMFDTEFSSSESAVTVAEFSSPSGASLEVIATLVLGFHESTATNSSAEDTDSEGMAVADTHEPASDRDLLMTGVSETPIQQHLKDQTNSETETEVLFSSPLDLFDVSNQVASQRSESEPHVTRATPVRKQDVTSKQHLPTRFLTGAVPPVTNSEAEILPPNSDHPKPPISASRVLPRASEKPRQSDLDGDISLDDRTSDSRIHLGLAICLVSAIPLTQSRSAAKPQGSSGVPGRQVSKPRMKHGLNTDQDGEQGKEDIE